MNKKRTAMIVAMTLLGTVTSAMSASAFLDVNADGNTFALILFVVVILAGAVIYLKFFWKKKKKT